MSDAVADSVPTGWRGLFDRRAVALLFLGFSAGLPILLIFSTLGIWLREAGVERSSVTMFSWAALGYSFKFVWAPLVDRLPVPLLTKMMGRRRSWVLVSQFAVMAAIFWMGSVDPSKGSASLTLMAFAAVLLGFSSATQDIVIDAYRIEIADTKLQALLSANYVAGYRIGMLFAGAGALFVAEYFASSMDAYNYTAWRYAYFGSALLMLVGVLTTLSVREPETSQTLVSDAATSSHLQFFLLFLLSCAIFVAVFWFSAGEFLSSAKASLSSALGSKPLAALLVAACRLAVAIGAVFVFVRAVMSTRLFNAGMFVEAYVEPVREFTTRYRLTLVVLLLALVGLYRISDIVLGVIANVFYIDMGYSKAEIASVVKTLGLFMTIGGGFLGGIIALRIGAIRVLFLGALLTILTNLLFVLLAVSTPNLFLLGVVISADNLTAGLASAAFIAFLSSLTNVKFTAVQYAIFSSTMTLFPKAIGGYSGTLVDGLGYPNFFILASLMGVPVLWLIWRVGRSKELDHLH